MRARSRADSTSGREGGNRAFRRGSTAMRRRMWIVSLVFAVFIAGDFGAARRSCANHDCETNCCMLPCLAQELVRARNMLEVYRELAGRDTVTNEEYDRKADRVTARQAELYKDLVRRSPQCVQKFPTFEQLRAGGSEVRRLQL